MFLFSWKSHMALGMSPRCNSISIKWCGRVWGLEWNFNRNNKTVRMDLSQHREVKCWSWSWKYDSWLILAQLCTFLLIKIRSKPMDESQAHSTPYIYCFSVILRHIWLTFYFLLHINFKIECYWSGRQKSCCSCHCPSKCIKSCRIRISTLGNPHCHNGILLQEMLYHLGRGMGKTRYQELSMEKQTWKYLLWMWSSFINTLIN